MIDIKTYQKICKQTASDNFATTDEEIMTWGLGMTGEAGDVASCIKKTYAHGNDQIKGIRENLGDTMWYIVAICNFYGWDLNEVLAENIEKLRKRFPEGFTIEKAKRDGTMTDWGEK